ncbi:hypothetical protein BS50DRAFT_584636 [Corynespora cassiicola Philippines]|uniref:F-box domain-containing protein n=1 Tax=Corynespora cassiicola Philippines TaxID=1448308 RepID=A0A2T2P0A3_CORCC|nr:hypothetical protein BS50DRAFT_584636 [Corynespora cassiicola Philippines]
MADAIRLPNEILFDVFERLRDKPSNLLNSMLCCQRWHDVALTVLYSHIALDSKLHEDSPVTRFASRKIHREMVQSFHLRISQVHLMGFSISSGEAFDRLSELCELFPRLERLKTFALSFEKPAGEGFLGPSLAIVSILKSLPKTVVNLNLECDSLSIPSLEEPHICNAMSALLPRLRSLRLQIPYLCSGFLSSVFSQATLDHENDHPSNATISRRPTSSLEYLVIRLDNRPTAAHGTSTCKCFSDDESLSAASLANKLHWLFKKGAFPSLRQFSVIDRLDAIPWPQNIQWNVFKTRTISPSTTQTTTFPWCARGGSSSLFMIRDFDGDWFGSFCEVSDALEGPLSWTQSGIKTKKQVQQEQDGAWELDRSKLESRRTVVQNFGVSLRLWQHEILTEAKLLWARTMPGLEDSAPVVQVLPEGWRWVSDGLWTWTIQPVAP